MNESKHVVSSEQERQALPPVAILIFGSFGIAIVLFILGGLWYMLGFKPAFILLLSVCIIGTGAWLIREIEHHHHDILDRKHIRELARIAIEKEHSLEFNPITRQLRTISPWTVPNAAITIKDNQFGNGNELAPALPIAPAFRSLISQIRPGHLFLAQGAAAPIWGDITDLLSTLDVGRPGTGKSTLLRMVCGQVMIIGGKPIIMDPHGSVLDDLGSEFECAESPHDIAQYSHLLDSQLTERLARRRAGQDNFQPLLLLVDEMPIISEMSPVALPAIRRVVLEGRKVGMYALVSGQGVPSSILGGTLVRDAMSSRYVFCTSPQQARMAGIENETAKQMMAILETAPPGKAVLATANRRPEIVAIPDTTTDDIRYLVNRRGNGKQPGNAVETDAETAPEATQEHIDDSVFTVSSEEDDVSSEESFESGNAIRETIKRMRKKGWQHRDIAPLVGLSGRKYSMYQAICKEEGIE
jgi:hypothetical protein